MVTGSWPAPSAARPLADQRQDLLLQIERQIGVVLEDAHLALGLQADAAGRGIGDAAVREADARVGDVDLVGEHRRADRIDGRDRRADDRLHDIDVVDHQVEHDVHVGAALLDTAPADGTR